MAPRGRGRHLTLRPGARRRRAEPVGAAAHAGACSLGPALPPARPGAPPPTTGRSLPAPSPPTSCDGCRRADGGGGGFFEGTMFRGGSMGPKTESRARRRRRRAAVVGPAAPMAAVSLPRAHPRACGTPASAERAGRLARLERHLPPPASPKTGAGTWARGPGPLGRGGKQSPKRKRGGGDAQSIPGCDTLGVTRGEPGTR